MKKILLWLIAVVACVSMVASFSLMGCKKEAVVETAADTIAAAETSAAATEAETIAEETAAEKVTLRVLSNWTPDTAKGTVFQEILDDFMAENPDITIETEVASDTEITTIVETTFLAGKEQDVLLHNLWPTTRVWVNDGVCISLSQYIKDWGLEDQFLTHAVEEYTFDGEIVAFPIEGFNWPVWYRSDVLEMAGLTEAPKTYAELDTFAKAARDNGFQPVAIGGGDWTGSCWFQFNLASMFSYEDLSTMMANGGWSENAKAVSLAEQFAKQVNDGVFIDDVAGQNMDTMNTAFFTGKAAAMHGGSWAYVDLPAEMQEEVVLGGMPLPIGAYYDKPIQWASFDAKGFWITRNGAEKIDAVEKFAKFFFSPDNIAKFVMEGSMIPSIKDVPVDEEALLPVFAQSLDLDIISILQPLMSLPPELMDLFDRTATGFFVQGITGEKILSDIDKMYEMVE